MMRYVLYAFAEMAIQRAGLALSFASSRAINRNTILLNNGARVAFCAEITTNADSPKIPTPCSQRSSEYGAEDENCGNN